MASETRNPWNVYREVFRSIQTLLHCHVCIMFLCCPVCSVQCGPWISQLFILAWVWGCSLEQVYSVSSGKENPPEGHQAHKRCVLSFQHRAMLAQCIPAVTLGMLRQTLGYCFFHWRAFPSTQAADFKHFRNTPVLTEIRLVIDF